MPDWRYAEGYRPVPGVLPDGSIAVIHELVAVVFELLAEVIQHRPGLMAGRTAQTVFAGEGRKGVRGLAASENHGCENENYSRERSRQLQDVAEMRTTRNAHDRTPRQDQTKIWFLKRIPQKPNKGMLFAKASDFSARAIIPAGSVHRQ